MNKREASIKRKTNETDIELSLNIDGTGICKIDTGMPFFEHMLEQICKHGHIDLNIKAKGDLEVDAHHTVEDIGICFGQAFDKAIGGKEGINRYGHAYVPLDEALSRVVIDFSGRPGVEYSASYPRQYINDFDVDLIHEFFQGFCNHAMVTLHIDNLKGEMDIILLKQYLKLSVEHSDVQKKLILLITEISRLQQKASSSIIGEKN